MGGVREKKESLPGLYPRIDFPASSDWQWLLRSGWELLLFFSYFCHHLSHINQFATTPFSQFSTPLSRIGDFSSVAKTLAKSNNQNLTEE